MNKVKQLGLALHQYANTYQDTVPTENGFNFATHTAGFGSLLMPLLPFLEGDNVIAALQASPVPSAWRWLDW